ncbi:hypothetical protein [Aquabacterium sp.]|uniref:hypothetical protein n=1 Tax=Aquabacterium sp. TaxID=1872578 RepID=UPI002488441E|nr:hypothetical protein [Aquabacterium sp.]MDI1259133.1 hypothetical protein [Aquabacterium sp.]
MKSNDRSLPNAMAVALMVFACTAAQAQDFSYSAFGTIGAAISNQDYRYQRFIDSDGSLMRDTVLGAQLDVQFTPELSATVQGKLAPSARNDQDWDLTASWAFASWRPNNDWLLRAGKLRIPLYLSSENLDVGQSYEFARLPTEMYSIAPTTDVTGLYITRNWALGNSDLSLDVYSGQAKVWVRLNTRDTGTSFNKYDTRVSGSVLTWRAEDTMLRFSAHHAVTRPDGGPLNPVSTQSITTPFGPVYDASGTTPKIRNDIITVGIDQQLPGNWRIMFEAERNIQHDTDLGANTAGGYIAVLKSMDKWTPYVSASVLKTVGAPARAHEALSQSSVPDLVPGVTDVINASQRRFADSIPFYDQHSLAIGSSYALTPHSKLKAEWLHTWVRKGSAMIDSPSAGPAVSNTGIDVLSISYNFAY